VSPDPAPPSPSTARVAWLPRMGSRGYYVLLAAVAMLVLGPLGGVTSSYMVFSVGFTVGGQVLAGILGSTVTYGYGADGKHGANYIQTMAASVASMAGMSVLVQAMVWLGMPVPTTWKLTLYFACIGMFGIGVGMLYTPILVDRLQLEYPSGHAVANILRALTDPKLLKRSIGKLGGGAFVGIVVPFVVARVAFLERIGASAATAGAGLIVGTRVGVPAAVMALVGLALTPTLRASGLLGPNDPFRKIGFLVGLAMIFGAGLVDMALIGVEAVRRLRAHRGEPSPPVERGLSTRWLFGWVVVWGAALTVVATVLLDQPLGFVLFGLVLVFLFVFVNGISNGITDWNPISSAFVIAVLLMSGLGLRSGQVAIMVASILLVSCSVGVDMQQDRSTGWRLGSDRTIQFRYQAIGILMGAALCVLFAKLFMNAYPVLRVDTFTHPEARAGNWQSAMTYKFVGAIRTMGNLPAYQLKALLLGLGIGFFTEVGRKLLARSRRYQAYIKSGSTGFAVGWILDAVLLSSPYASSTGGFLDIYTSLWFAGGSLLHPLLSRRRPAPPSREVRDPSPGPEEEGAPLPADMSTPSLIGGGLIAGESLYTLVAGIIALMALVR
jgi:uncharacterized oligopeptide transporter (OPT) family protein